MSNRRTAVKLFERGARLRARELVKRSVEADPRDLYMRELAVWFPADRFAPDQPKSLRTFMNRDTQKGGEPVFHERGETFSRPTEEMLDRFDDAEGFLRTERVKDGEGILIDLVAAGLDGATIRHSLALARLHLGYPRVARKEFEAALGLDPAYLPAMRDYAWWLLIEGRFDRLMSLTDSAMSGTLDEHAPLYMGGAEVVRELKVLRKASEAVRDAVALLREGKEREGVAVLWSRSRPVLSFFPVLRTITYLCFRSDWTELARRRFGNSLGETSSATYLEGLLEWYGKRPEAALERYDELVERIGPDPTLLISRAIALVSVQRHDEAEIDLRQVLDRAPWLVTARGALSMLLMQRGDTEALVELADLSADERKMAIDYEVVGREELAGLEVRALRSLRCGSSPERAIARIEGGGDVVRDRWLHLERGLVLAAGGREDRALAELEKATGTNWEPPCPRREGDWDLVRELAGRHPDQVAPALIMALAPAASGEPAKAKELLMKLVERFPEDVRIRMQLAGIHHQLGEDGEAEALCHQVLQAAPDHEEAFHRLVGILASRGYVDGLAGLEAQPRLRAAALETAVWLAAEGGQTERAKELAQELFALDVDGPQAAAFLLSVTEPATEEYLEYVAALVRRVPFDDHLRMVLVRLFVERGRLGESLGVFDQLLGDGEELPVQLLAQYALASLWTTKETPQP